MRSLSATPPSRLFRFLGSMPLAVTLLAAVAIASVIGTLLQQNQPYNDYIIKFGPFWHAIYQRLGLYDVYSSLWFLLLLAFLIVSTSVCLIQNGPAILRNARDFRERMTGGVLGHMPQADRWHRSQPGEPLAQSLVSLLQQYGYRLRRQHEGGRILIAAKKGSANRLGYICAHLAVVVICIGGLLDGNIPMKLQTLTGALEIETRDLPASQIPPSSHLDSDNSSFRANISIPEGAGADFAFIRLGPGYVLQQLPFSIRLKEFRIEHYSTGQPKSFESDIVLHDPARDRTIEQTISVNQPLRYHGFNIYQASFEDGGSRLDLTLHSLKGATATTSDLQARVGETSEVATRDNNKLRLEIDNFRRFNIIQDTAAVERSGNFRDTGPSFTFKLRQADGTAREFINYMQPVSMDGRDYLVSGMRDSPAEDFRYLYLPLDMNGSPQRFLQLVHLLHDDQRLRRIINGAGHQKVAASDQALPPASQQLNQAMLEILRLFRDGGFSAIAERIDATVPADQREAAAQALIKLLHNGLALIYRNLLSDNGTPGAETLSPEQVDFMEAALQALAALPNYGSPFFVELTDFEQRQASGLMIARSPGKLLVYPGFALLLAGVFLLFYIAQRRIWFELKPDADGGLQVLMAGESNRLQPEFDKEFAELNQAARQIPENLASR